MKIISRLLSLVIFGILISSTAFSQTKRESQKPLSVIVYNANVEASLTAEELRFITEVYGDKTQDDVLNQPHILKEIKNILRNRVEIMNAGDKNLDALQKLSSVDLVNMESVPEFSFNPKTFNPLKYNFNFYSRNSSYYHVDNTSFYIYIKSQYD